MTNATTTTTTKATIMTMEEFKAQKANQVREALPHVQRAVQRSMSNQRSIRNLSQKCIQRVQDYNNDSCNFHDNDTINNDTQSQYQYSVAAGDDLQTYYDAAARGAQISELASTGPCQLRDTDSVLMSLCNTLDDETIYTTLSGIVDGYPGEEGSGSDDEDEDDDDDENQEAFHHGLDRDELMSMVSALTMDTLTQISTSRRNLMRNSQRDVMSQASAASSSSRRKTKTTSVNNANLVDNSMHTAATTPRGNGHHHGIMTSKYDSQVTMAMDSFRNTSVSAINNNAGSSSGSQRRLVPVIRGTGPNATVDCCQDMIQEVDDDTNSGSGNHSHGGLSVLEDVYNPNQDPAVVSKTSTSATNSKSKSSKNQDPPGARATMGPVDLDVSIHDDPTVMMVPPEEEPVPQEEDDDVDKSLHLTPWLVDNTGNNNTSKSVESAPTEEESMGEPLSAPPSPVRTTTTTSAATDKKKKPSWKKKFSLLKKFSKLLKSMGHHSSSTTNSTTTTKVNGSAKTSMTSSHKTSEPADTSDSSTGSSDRDLAVHGHMSGLTMNSHATPRHSNKSTRQLQLQAQQASTTTSSSTKKKKAAAQSSPAAKKQANKKGNKSRVTKKQVPTLEQAMLDCMENCVEC